MQLPVAMEETPAYIVHFGETILIPFYFVDSTLSDPSDPDSALGDLTDLKIRLMDETTLVGVVAQSSVEYEKKGFGKITLVIDGETAKGLLPGTATASEESQEAPSLTGSVTIEVKTVESNERIAYFEVNFTFIEQEVEEEKEPEAQ